MPEIPHLPRRRKAQTIIISDRLYEDYRRSHKYTGEVSEKVLIKIVPETPRVNSHRIVRPVLAYLIETGRIYGRL